jgi:Ca2+-binding RTX toxin-like protein
MSRLTNIGKIGTAPVATEPALGKAGIVINGTEKGDFLNDLTRDGADLGGDDTINAGGGNDTVNAGFGNDTIYDFGGGNDTFRGEGGNDTFHVLSGANVIDGGADIDTVSYASSLTTVDINLAAGYAQSKGGRDTLISIENAIGSNADDALTGNSANNLLQGGGGIDRLDGGAGQDTLIGGDGADYMIGGAGADKFVFEKTSDFGAVGWDTVADFQRGVDKIDLSKIDARPDVAGMQKFTFDASQDGATEEFLDSLGGAGLIGNKGGPTIEGDPGEIEIRYEDGFTYVFVSNYDGYTEAAFRLRGNIDLSASDFIF